jgi:hypothetical protein
MLEQVEQVLSGIVHTVPEVELEHQELTKVLVEQLVGQEDFTVEVDQVDHLQLVMRVWEVVVRKVLLL